MIQMQILSKHLRKINQRNLRDPPRCQCRQRGDMEEMRRKDLGLRFSEQHYLHTCNCMFDIALAFRDRVNKMANPSIIIDQVADQI
jgi:hypothetical protein